jgi:hypothetical protein
VAPESAGVEFRDLPLRVPKSITRTLFERYTVILNLSDEQRAYAEVLLDQHLKECNSIARSEAPLIVGAFEGLQMSSTSQPDFQTRYVDLLAACDTYDDKLSAADDRFFATIESFLGESQVPGMARVRMHRGRDRSPTLENRINESIIDLSALVEQQGLDTAAMAEVDAILVSYEEAVTPRIVARDRDFRHLLPRANFCLSRAFVAADGRPLEVEKNPSDMQQRQAMFKEFQQIWRDLSQHQMEIARLNREYLPQVLAKLPPVTAKSINGTYSMIAWSYVYPDKTDPTELYEALLASKGLDDDIRAGMREHWTQYRAKYEDLCAHGRILNEEHEHQLASTRGGTGIAKRRQEIFALMWQRILLNKRCVAALKAMLPPDVASAHENALHDYDLRIKRARPPQAPPSEPAPFDELR